MKIITSKHNTDKILKLKLMRSRGSNNQGDIVFLQHCQMKEITN